MRIPPITNSGLDLRDYQSKFKRDVFEAWRNGAVDICGVMPTGAGKTRTSSSVIHEFSAAGMPTMMAAHRSELVGQLSCAMAAEGITHNIIASKSTIRAVSNAHVAKLGRSYYHPEARAMVSSVDTLIRRDVSSFADQICLYMTDECFPAWVEVDGKPIRDIKVGDMVSAFNEDTGEIERREVVRLFKNKAPDYMISVVTVSGTSLDCTPGHPFYTQRGWVRAAELKPTDMLLERSLSYVGLKSLQAYESFSDDYVYNIEVQGLHTYIANGVVVHNCHHLTRENKWGKCRSLFTKALGLGVSATPERSDGQGLGRHADGFFDTLVEGPKMRELIRMGFLTDYRIFCPPSDFDVSSVAAGKDGDYNRNQLQAASKKSHIVGDVVAHYKKIAMGKRGVTFCVSVEDAEDIAAQFNASGVPAMVLTGNNTDAERADAIKLLESGDILQIVAIDIISEGFDLPAIEVVSFARPTQSYSLFIQMFGRALRLFPGKSHAIIIDHVSNVERFISRGRGLPDTPQQWTLDRRERGARSVKAADVIDLTTCLNPECFNLYDPALPSCPWCGAVPAVGESGRSAPERVPGDLYEMPADLLAQLRGEADNIMQPDYVDRVRQDMLAKHAPTVGVHAAAKRAGMQQESQRRLRDAMARWTNLWERNGLPVRDVQIMFNQVFGCDILTAQTLGLRESDELCGRVSGALSELGL